MRPVQLPASVLASLTRRKTPSAASRRQASARKSTDIATAMTCDPDGSLRLVLPRALRSPNVTYYASTWVKRRDRINWEAHLRAAILLATPTVRSMGIAYGHTRVRVTVERHVRTRREFIADDDNLRFCVKPLNDALKRVGLIKDDNRAWITQATPTETLSLDGRARTVVTITPFQPQTQEPA